LLNIVDKIFRLFTVNDKFNKIFESEETFEKKIIIDELLLPDETALTSAVSELNHRDTLAILIKIGAAETVSFHSQKSKLNDFLVSVTNELADREASDQISIEIKIQKKIKDSLLSIYDLGAFQRYLGELNFLELLTVFETFLKNDGYIIFQCFLSVANFSSSSLYFSSNIAEIDLSNIQTAVKRKRNESINTNCHYGNSAELSLIPEDFKLTKRSQSADINLLLDRLALIHCIISLFDIRHSNEKGIYYKLNGYKSISNEIDFKSMDVSSLSEYFEIYQWTYEGGNLSDKIGLVRNIISIHLENDKTIELKGQPYASIKSGFEIYLKQNIKQYIDIRNKISDQLLDFSKRANLIVDNFASNFQKSIFAFLSFFASVFVLRVLSKADYKHVLSPDTTILCLTFLGISIVFLIFSTWEIKEQRKRFVLSYSNLKERYQDLLVSGDIEKILNNDRDFNEDLKFIDQKKKKYRQMWIITLVIFFITISILYFLGNSNVHFCPCSFSQFFPRC
jgi:hypothetical protein